MGLIPDSEMTAIRAAVQTVLDSVCVVTYSAGTSKDGFGHETTNWATRATVNASLRKPSAALQALYADRVGTLAQWVVHLPWGTTVDIGDHLSVDGQLLTVAADLSISSYSTLKTVLAAEIME